MSDSISRQAAIDALMPIYKSASLRNRNVFSTARKCMAAIEDLPSAQIRTAEVRQSLLDVPSAEVEPVKHGQWIPVSERLPEEDTEVLISYRYKEGEGDTSHVDIDITTYGQMYFGGNKVGNNKHWRAPFEYFYSNYEVIAWMPLPEPYKEEGEPHEQN